MSLRQSMLHMWFLPFGYLLLLLLGFYSRLRRRFIAFVIVVIIAAPHRLVFSDPLSGQDPHPPEFSSDCVRRICFIVVFTAILWIVVVCSKCEQRVCVLHMHSQSDELQSIFLSTYRLTKSASCIFACRFQTVNTLLVIVIIMGPLPYIPW